MSQLDQTKNIICFPQLSVTPRRVVRIFLLQSINDTFLEIFEVLGVFLIPGLLRSLVDELQNDLQKEDEPRERPFSEARLVIFCMANNGRSHGKMMFHMKK